jgi:hypothetical protein
MHPRLRAQDQDPLYVSDLNCTYSYCISRVCVESFVSGGLILIVVTVLDHVRNLYVLGLKPAPVSGMLLLTLTSGLGWNFIRWHPNYQAVLKKNKT